MVEILAFANRLNRWYRKHAKPHGKVDHYYCGTRMTLPAAYRNLTYLSCIFVLAIAYALYFVPGKLKDKYLVEIFFLKIIFGLLAFVSLLTPLYVFREFVVITDDGLIKSNLFGRETRMNWKEIQIFEIEPDKNILTFKNSSKEKIRMNLAYDGWQDFLEMASKHLHPTLYLKFADAFAEIQAIRQSH